MKYLILLFPLTVFAGDYYRYDPQPINVPVVLDFSTLNDTLGTTETPVYNDCQSVAIGQSASAAQMYNVRDPQVAFGLGECGGEWAGTVRGGMKVKNLILNGGWSFDEKVNTFSFGTTIVW